MNTRSDQQDRWLSRLRFLLGSGAFVWEVVWDPHDRWWVIVISLWLLGGPIEELLSLITRGRLSVSISRKDTPGQDRDP